MTLSFQKEKWYDLMDFDLWGSFVYKGHSFDLSRLMRGKVSRAIIEDDKHITLQLEEAKKALYNHLKRIALETRTHLLVWAGGEHQPINQLPHYHTAIKLSRRDNMDKVIDLLNDDWKDKNPSSHKNPSALVVPFIQGLDGINYIEKHKDKWIDTFCPKRAVRCKKNKCKGVSAFRL